ncbi:MAG TPA: two-component regulator propeller domain-containing protein [Pseudacidobacterium sp.]|jgi:ligand-binding sensor domain-containing protein/signal transduction histidine kinase|nr:two-component regulator propeller domain-containing protein [Pseudacidobacterium sp.]
MFTRRQLWVICYTCLFFLAGLRASALDPHYSLRNYGYQSWQTDDGLPQNTVHAVLQTRDGFVWFATEAGLVRFDGVQFTVFDKSNTPQISSNVINSLFEDKSGALWISTADGLIVLQDRHFRSFNIKDGLPTGIVFSVFQDRSGGLWALTATGIARYVSGRFEALPNVPALSDTAEMAETSDGSLWVSTGNGLFRIKDHNATTVSIGEQPQAIIADHQGGIWIGSHLGLKIISQEQSPVPFHLPTGLGPDVSCLLNASDGHIWIGTTNGLGEFDGKTMHVYTTRDGLPDTRITGLFEDRQHAVWVATGHGIARIFSGHVESFAQQQGLSSNQVIAFYEDREGNLWLGTESGGVGVLRDRKFTTYTSQDGLTDDLVRSVFQTRSGVVLAGTNGGGVNQYTNGRFAPLTGAASLSSRVALALADDKQGNLWVGTPDGLNRIDGNHTSVFTSADGLADDFVRSLYTDHGGALWIGTRRGLSRYRDGSFTSYSAMDGLGSDLVGAITEDADGSLWIGTLGGLTHLADGRFTNYTTQQGLSSNIITALYQDSAGTLWIGTNGGGLNAGEGGKFITFPEERTHLPQNIYGILEDASGNLWLGTDKGIFRISRQELHKFATGKVASIMPDVFGTADGMRISECSSGGHPAAWKAQDGTLWFATLRGIATVDPAHMPVNRAPPLVAIEQVSVDEAPLSTREGMEIAPGHTRFAFQYAGLSFTAPQKVRFRYKLDGVDRDWVDAGARRTAYYTNIPPGQHTFRVMARNNDGVWSEQAAMLSFRLRPRFYQTYWFYILLLAFAGLLAYIIYRWRVRSVESRFNAVLAERNRIAREIHDTLAQGFVAVSVQLEVVARLLNSSTDAAREHLEQARKLTRECIDEARSSIWNLRSQGLGRNDLAAAITSAAERITAKSNIKPRVQVSGTYRPVASSLEVELVRIAQEAITNAVRHAQATRVDVTLLFQEKLLRMTIKDDGCGFEGDPDAYRQNGHFGLTGMRERAEQIGAQFAVSSAKGCGTEVKVDVAI